MAVLMPHSIFIHIPKTGGSWVRSALMASGIQCREVGPPGADQIRKLHCTVKGLPKHLRRGRLVFFCIRHPVAWLKSRWSYAIEHGKLNTKRKKIWIERLLDPSLNVFIENVLRSKPSVPSNGMLHPVGWKKVDGIWRDTLKKKDRILGRTETLREDLTRFLHRAGETFDQVVLDRMAPKRVSGKKSKQQVSPELARRVCDANQFLMDLGHYDVSGVV